MTFLAPGFLYAAGALAVGVVVLHFLVTQQPRSDVLPTVRFFPDVPARSTSVTIRFSDLLLLLVRVLTILAIGAAFAQPQLTPKHSTVARLVVVDASRGVRNPAELADSARKYTQGAAVVVWSDSTARELNPKSVADSINALANGQRVAKTGSLTPGLITAMRAAARVRDRADSLDLVVISPFAREEQDAATGTVRQLWPGHINAVRVAAVTDTVATKNAQVHLEWVDSLPAGANTRWTARPKADTIGAVRVGDAVMIYPFVRRWRVGALDGATRVAARWSDGEPAAVERMENGTCLRSIAISAPTAGDAILRPEYVRLSDALRAPCGVTRNMMPLSETFMTAFTGGPALASVGKIKPRITTMTSLVPWLLGAALLLALLELLARRYSAMALREREAQATAEPTATRRAA